MEVHLMQWPCGCVVDASVIPSYALWHVAYECPWCGVVVSRPELVKWITECETGDIHMTEVFPLLLVGEEVLEAGDPCLGCSTPLVREARTCSAKWRHLRVPFSAVIVLRN